MTGSGPGWVDAHCHIDGRLPGGEQSALDAARGAGVRAMLTVGCDRVSSLTAIDVAGRHPDVWATVGLHPHDARHGVETIADLLDRPRVLAVGECGLDYYYEHSPRDVQRAAFAAQIALAHERHLPLVVHTRDAWDDTFDVLGSEAVPERIVFHCFTGDADIARRCLDLGAYLSFSGIVTFPNAPEVRAAALACRLDRLLVETDSPFLAPVPYRGRANQPGHVAVVGAFIAELRGLPVDEVASVTSDNARTVFPGLGA